MSTNDLELVTCDRCQRRYDIEVYHRHRDANQCIKRNQSRLPFQSIKQRSIQIGDQVFSVRSSEKNAERKKQLITKPKQSQEQLQRFLPSNTRRRALEQAKQLLERRTKYQPPWIQKRSSSIKPHPLKVDDSLSRSNHRSRNLVDQSTQKSHSYDRLSPPRTKFPTDDLPIKSSSKNEKVTLSTSNRSRYHHQPILTHSPKKTRVHQSIPTSKPRQPPIHEVDQTFSHEPVTSASRSVRKANTWTRSSKQSTNRDLISPIQIPTYNEFSTDRMTLPSNQNYDDDDEFERYSPTPTPRCIEQQALQRPRTYQKSKRSDRQTQESKEDNPISSNGSNLSF